MSKPGVNKPEKMVAVYRAVGEAEARIIKGILESHGITCFLKSNAAPSVHMFAVDGMGEVKVMVWEEVARKARALIEGKGNA
ncbi:MAG: DUF2007 domain-containing protein [Dehalococcoidia bacterium]|nr:MAG: DUF2007 domain-containing protein [Dehalococcoidia bacterium]